MPIKTLLILLSLISYPSVSGAEQINWQKYSLMQGKDILFSQADSGEPSGNSEPVSPIQSKPSKSIKLVSPWMAFFLASIPLTTSTLAWVIEAQKVNDLKYFAYAPIYTLVSVTLFTIPAHLYVHDTLLNTSVIITSKALLASAITFFSTHDCNSDQECDRNVGLSFLGIISYTSFYIGELIYIPFAAKQYNEKINNQQQGFYVLPYAYKDQYRVNVGYRF